MKSEEAEKAEKRRYLLKDIFRILIIGMIFIMAGIIFRSETFGEHFSSVERIRDTLHSDDTVAEQFQSYVIFLLAGSTLIAVGLPRSIVCVIGGGIYGAVLGGALSLLASLAGAAGTYFLGGSLFKSMLRRRLGKRFQKFEGHFRRNAFTYALNLRLFPLSNATVTSLICGVCGADFRSYMAANMIGFLPLTVVYTLLGSGAMKGKPNQLIFGILLFVAMTIAQYAWTRYKAKRERRDHAPQTP